VHHGDTVRAINDYASGRVLGWLFRRSQEMADAKDYDLLNAIDLQKRATWAIVSPQSELFRSRDADCRRSSCDFRDFDGSDRMLHGR
jgi:hypothetical protein